MLILRGHDAPVRCLAYAPRSGLLATGDDAGAVWLWGAGTNPRACLMIEGGVEALTFSPDGTRLAVGAADGSLVLLRGPEWEEIQRTMAHEGGVRCLLYAPDGQLLSSGWRGGLLLHQEPSPSASLIRDAVPVTALALLPDGVTLATGQLNGALSLIDLRSCQVHPLANLDASVFTLACSPGGELLASGGHGDGSILLWDLATASRARSLQRHTWTVYALAFTPDGRLLLSGGADGTVRVWDVASCRQTHCFAWHTRWVTCLAVAPDGLTTVAGSADHSVVVWDLSDE